MEEKLIFILGHTLGINVYHAKTSNLKKDKKLPKKFYRNYFCAGDEKHHDYPVLFELESLKLMERYTRFGQLLFCVTDEGIEKFKNEFNKLVGNHGKDRASNRKN
jgi:hypothetical protein